MCRIGAQAACSTSTSPTRNLLELFDAHTDALGSRISKPSRLKSQSLQVSAGISHSQCGSNRRMATTLPNGCSREALLVARSWSLRCAQPARRHEQATAFRAHASPHFVPMRAEHCRQRRIQLDLASRGRSCVVHANCCDFVICRRATTSDQPSHGYFATSPHMRVLHLANVPATCYQMCLACRL